MASWRGGQRLSSRFSAWISLLQQADLVVRVEDGEVALQPGELGMAAQQRPPIEWNVPSQGMPSTFAADQHADAVLHLARRLVGEGDGEDLEG
jgi:hypothetical protein